MLIKNYPEFFASYKIYELVKNTMKGYMREKEVEQVISGLMAAEAKPDNFIKKLAVVASKYLPLTRNNDMIIRIKEKISDLAKVGVEPKKIVISKNGKETLRVSVENKTEATLKFRVGVQQLDRTYTALIHDAVTNFSKTKSIKAGIIEPNKVHVFKFIIKPDIYGIQDLYELKKNKKISMTLGMQVDAEGIEGLKTPLSKIGLDIVTVKI